jgi:hypothetical protein
VPPRARWPTRAARRSATSSGRRGGWRRRRGGDARPRSLNGYTTAFRFDHGIGSLGRVREARIPSDLNREAAGPCTLDPRAPCARSSSAPSRSPRRRPPRRRRPCRSRAAR